jgi:hypothetical protein
MFWFVVLLLLVGAGFYLYQKLTAIEAEIRAEQAAEKSEVTATDGATPVRSEAEPQEEGSIPPVVTSEVEGMSAKVAPVDDEGMSVEDEIIAAVANLPGIMQSDLYASFPELDKKRLQQLIKELADSGQLARYKQGSSYLLYPTEVS